MTNLIGATQHLLPPALLSYFFFAWRITTFDIALYIYNELSYPLLARIYRTLPTLLVGTITILYLRLYFLPSSQSVPPREPPSGIKNRRVIFECLSPAEATTVHLANGVDNASRHGTHRDNDSQDSDHDGEINGDDIDIDNDGGNGGDDSDTDADNNQEPMINRCWKGRCGGRWKPARARHCSQCGTCRAGFDHHCPIFANCLTAAHLPTFLLLLILTPPTTFILSLPLYVPLAHRTIAAFQFAWTDKTINEYWYAWKWSWVVAGGPVGRFLGAIILGWRALDVLDGSDPHSYLRLAVAAVVGFGIILALICAGLAYTSINLILQGQLTVDRGRAEMHTRTRTAIAKLLSEGKQIPPQLIADENAWATARYFSVPIPTPTRTEVGKGKCSIIEWNDVHGVRRHAYDRGPKGNWELIMSPGWRWLVPWNVLCNRVGLTNEELFNWPVAPDVDKWLREKALDVID